MVISADSRSVKEIAAESGLAMKEDHEALYNALCRLSDADVELIELRFFEDRPFKEVGEILEITENNAKVRTYRVLDKLKTLMSDEK
jgi:RNA polymerase sigma-70 factor, ECF subfamily